MKPVSAFLFAFAALALGGCVVSPPAPATEPQAAGGVPACADGLARKVLVTAFPLRYPEQLRPGEYMGWAQTTGEELARRLRDGGRLRVAPATERFPFAEAEAAPEVERNAQGMPRIVEWAAHEHAQYVVAGLIRDFGTARNQLMLPERQLVVEAYVYDSRTGRLLARHEFARQLLAGGALPKTVAPGTREFAASRLGQTYGALLADIGRWAEESIACLPFALRVTQVDGLRLHLDVGSDSGLKTGMLLSTTATPTTAAAKPAGGAPPGRQLPTAVIKETGVSSSIAEIPRQRTPPKFQVGDVLYLPEPSQRNKP